MNIAKPLCKVTLAEFEAMAKNERFNYELIDGVVMMSPSPSREHQTIAAKIITRASIQLENTNCTVIHELDIAINGSSYRPDVMVFCDDEPNENLPVIIFEILSPSTKRIDLTIKLSKYEAMGVLEYWIIDPKLKAVIVHDFVNQSAETYGLGETIQSAVRLELQIELAKIFI